MTRKDELEQRAADLASGPVSPYDVYEALAKVEREVWEKAARIVEGGRFISDYSMEYVWARQVAAVLRKQQEQQT